MSDTDWRRTARRNSCVENLNQPELEPDKSTKGTRHETCKKDSTLKITRLVNCRYREVLEFCTYRLANTLGLYNSQVTRIVPKWAKRLQVKISTSILDPFDPISFTALLYSFRLARDTNVVHERKAMWLLRFLIIKKVVSALKSRIEIREKSSCNCQKEGILIANCEVTSYLQKTYAPDDRVPESDAKIMRRTQPQDDTPIEYAQNLWANALSSLPKYKEYVLKAKLIKGI